MTAQAPVLREHGNSYNIFILVLTLFSLAVMVVLLMPLDDDTRQLLTLVGQRGWLDLLGSIPSVGVFQLGALLRLARLSRLARIGKLLSGKNRKALVADVLHNRGQYATFITILLAGMVLSVASVLVLQLESGDPDANIKTGGDAIWWGIVTITTVGYGDFYPVTFLGRLTGVSVMVAGIGIIGALASILASMLVSPSTPDAAAADAEPAAAPVAAPSAPAEPQATSAIVEELAALRAEIAALRASLPPEPR